MILTGSTFDETTKPYIEIYTALADKPHKGYTLLVAPMAGDTFDVLAPASQAVPPAILEAWADSIAMTTKLMTDASRPMREWSAIIGPPSARIGESRIGVDCEGLASPGRLGPLLLSSTGQKIVEFRPIPEQPSLSGGSLSASVPILVKGSHPGYSWDEAEVLAARDLQRACGLLSVAWGVCVAIRQSPAPLEWGVRTIPEDASNLPGIFSCSTATDITVDRQIPTWAEEAWIVISKSPRLGDAIGAFHEGMQVEYSHPSLALVAFIASVEAISLMLFHEDRCQECKTHRYLRAKFTETLKLVLREDEAAELATAYSPRSKTLHRGQLHGYEPLTGSFRVGIWPMEERHTFRWNWVYRMRNACQGLLSLALKEGLPRKRRFSPDGSH